MIQTWMVVYKFSLILFFLLKRKKNWVFLLPFRFVDGWVCLNRKKKYIRIIYTLSAYCLAVESEFKI
jgi:hypothetical protein